jgi:hypothetical protein
MNYKKIYERIIENAKNRTVLGYSEKHHIIPKCMGGDNKKTNIVRLTAKEHYVCHKILCEIYPNENKLKWAFWRMCNIGQHKKQIRDYRITSNEYERIKIEISKIQSERVKNYSSELRSLISKKSTESKKGKPSPRKGIPNPKHSEWMKENNPFKGKTHSDEHKSKLKELGSKPKSEEHKRKISEKLKGNKPSNMRQIMINDVLYESLSEAARQLVLPLSTVKNRLKSNSRKYINWNYE